MKKFIKISAYVFAGVALLMMGAVIYFNSSYPKDIPASAEKVEVTEARVLRGKYIAEHVAVCIDCHSTRDWSKFSGPIIPGTEGKGGDVFDERIGMPGKIFVKNITPAALRDWSDGELIRAIVNGLNKHNEALFPIMPYTNYNKMTAEDLYSVVAYIRTLKPIENKVPDKELNFPLNFIVKTLPLEQYIPSNQVDKNNTVKYGEYLATIAGCGDCHSQSVEGKPVEGMQFAGGNTMHLPFGSITAPNLTPDKETGMGNITKEQFINRFKQFASDESKNVTVAATDFNTIMPWTMYSGMTEEDLGAIYDYLMSLKPVKNQVVRFAPAKN